MIAALSGALLVIAPSRSSAQFLQAGDIVVPGVRVIDGFGNTNGCFYRLRGGVVTRLWESSSFRGPRDMMVDAQGRLVFMASPASRNVNDTALFRLDPATGELERLFYFPYIVAVGDTLPQGASNATGFYGVSQSLHLEKRMEIVIDDDQNGGWPQVQSGNYYGFAMQTSVSSGSAPTNYRLGANSGTCEVGVSTALLPWASAPYMASEGNFIYYGLHSVIGRTGLDVRVELHLDGDWGRLDFTASPPPKNELIIAGNVFDNTRYPNGTVDCGSAIDSDVPFTSNGSTFSVLSMDALGVLGGSLYVTSPSGATGTPYVFAIAPRAPYLNPYACFWDTATKGTGMLDFNLPDGTPTSATLTSPDGSALLGLGNGAVKRVDMNGAFEVLDASQPYSGRPWRWHGPSSQAVAATSAAAVADSGSQVLVVRVDALACVMLTDAQGRRIGYDAGGNPANDLGAAAELLSSETGGWPRLIVLREPPSGVLSAEVAATAAGDWSVKAYLAHENGGSLLTATTGTASGPGSVFRGLWVGQPTVLTWFADPVAGVGDPDASPRSGFISIGPVPSGGEVRMAIRVTGNGARVRLDIYDIAGRLLTTPVNDIMEGGTHTFSWSGTLPSGRRLANGVYLARLDVNGRREIRRIVLAR
jgi:hypothetical protein